MAQMRISRNAATPKGFLRRMSDAGFEQVDDPRRQAWVVHPLAALLKLGVLALASHARSVRAVEVRSEQLRPTVRAQIGLKERVSAPWTMHPDGVLVVGLLRAIAINILAVLRALSRYKRGQKWIRPTWKMVIEQALLTLCLPILDTTEFDAFEA